MSTKNQKPGPKEERLVIGGDPDNALRTLIGTEKAMKTTIEVHYFTGAAGAQFTCPVCGERRGEDEGRIEDGEPTPTPQEIVSKHLNECSGGKAEEFKAVPVVN